VSKSMRAALVALVFGAVFFVAQANPPGPRHADAAISSFTFSSSSPKYRSAITAADSTTVNPAVFTGGTIPVIVATGQPNLFVTARFANSGDTIGVTPCALNIDSTGTVTVLALGSEITLAAAATPLSDGTKTYSVSGLASAYGAKSALPDGAGLVTHVAWLVTTAPTSGHSTDLYAWLSG
jgi:hypothetical protein